MSTLGGRSMKCPLLVLSLQMRKPSTRVLAAVVVAGVVLIILLRRVSTQNGVVAQPAPACPAVNPPLWQQDSKKLTAGQRFTVDVVVVSDKPRPIVMTTTMQHHYDYIRTVSACRAEL